MSDVSQPLCKCGHERKFHSGGDSCWTPHNFVGQRFVPCACGGYTPAPPPTREPIRLTGEEREPACPACGHALDSPDGCSECPAPTLTAEAEAEAAWRAWIHECPHLCNTDRCSFLAGFRAARLAGGPTLADAWDECCKAFAWAMKENPTLAPVSWLSYVHNNNPYRTPESEDTE